MQAHVDPQPLGQSLERVRHDLEPSARREKACRCFRRVRRRDRDGARCTSLRCVSVRSTIRNWWPIAAFLSLVLAVQVVFTNSIVANGKHASDHLQSAQVIFPVVFFLAVIFWAAREARRHADAWVEGAMVGLAFSVVALGNLRVVWAIGGGRWTDAQARVLGAARPRLAPGHSLVGKRTTARGAALLLFIAPLRTPR